MSDNIEIDLSEYSPGPALSRWAGVSIRIYDRFNTGNYREFFPFAKDAGKQWQLSTFERAEIIGADGERIIGDSAKRIRDRLTMPPIFDPSSPEERTRAYIPGLWTHMTTPAFVGPKGWGKTKLLCQLVAALIIPGRRFLELYPPAEMTDEERRRDVWLVVPETRAGAIHEELLSAGLQFGYRDGIPCYSSETLGLGAGVLIVEHLQGRAAEFDLTDPAKTPYWVDRLVHYTDQHKPPLTVIVDGITAVLRNDTSKYGAFTSSFRELLRLSKIPNGLGVMHSPMGSGVDTPMNGVESMGEWDGMWLASAASFPVEPATKRYLRSLPRLGDENSPRRRIILMADGMLALVDLEGRVPSTSDEPVRTAREEIVERLAESKGWMWTKDVCGAGDLYASDKKELQLLEEQGIVVSRNQSEGKVRGYQWRLSS